MGRFICALTAAMAMSAAVLTGQAPSGQKPATEKLTPQSQAAAKNLIQDVSTEGCVRLWKPAPDDPTRMPPDRQPGLAGVYLLTPIASAHTLSTDLPTYLLTPSAT